MTSSPMSRLVFDYLAEGKPPSFDWVVEYVVGDTIAGAWEAEASAAKPSPYAMLALLTLLPKPRGRNDRLFRGVEAVMVTYAELGWQPDRLVNMRAADTSATSATSVVAATRRVLVDARAQKFSMASDRSRGEQFWALSRFLQDAGMIYYDGGNATPLYNTGIFTAAMRLMRKRDENSAALLCHELARSLGQWADEARVAAAISLAVEAPLVAEIMATLEKR